MANISIRNLDDSIKEALRLRAAAEHCSMEEFLRRCLAEAAEKGAKSADTGQNSANPAEQAAYANAAQGPEQDRQRAGGNIAPAYALPASNAAALQGRIIVLIIGGSIAAYKALELIRLLRRAGAVVRVVMTKAAQHFITPLVTGALAGGPVYGELFSREDEQDVGHIRLARMADIVLVVAATASRLAKMAAGQADDLAGAVLLATHAPIMLAPAMNPAMWAHKATQRNLALLRQDGCRIIGPEQGEMAESGEAGLGRMSESAAIFAALAAMAAEMPPQNTDRAIMPEERNGPLTGKHIIVTSGPTYEALDPVRYLANHSSGKQGHALAAALAHLGARVTLISGPVQLPDPPGVKVVHIVSAQDMLAAALAALPADAAIFVAAVADWRPQHIFSDKIKKLKIRITTAGNPRTESREGMEMTAGQVKLTLVENPDILASIGHHAQRPRLVIGFAAETADLIENASAKLKKKGADWIIANNVARRADNSSVMGGNRNHIHIISRAGVEEWPEMPKAEVADRLAGKIAAALQENSAAED